MMLDAYASTDATEIAVARDGLFPQRFERLSGRGVPAFGIVASATLSSVAVLVSYLGSAGIVVFDTLVLMTGISAAIPYAFSALAQNTLASGTSSPFSVIRACAACGSPRASLATSAA